MLLPAFQPHLDRIVVQHGPAHFSRKLIDSAAVDPSTAVHQLNTSLDGLSAEEAVTRLAHYGPNVVAREARLTFLARLWGNVKNPLVILLAALAVISLLTGDVDGAIIIGFMVLLGIVLRFVQEMRADSAAEKLKEQLREFGKDPVLRRLYPDARPDEVLTETLKQANEKMRQNLEAGKTR